MIYVPDQMLQFKKRHELLNYFPEDSRVVELGVYNGKFASKMLKHVKIKTYTGIDGWDKAYGKTSEQAWGFAQKAVSEYRNAVLIKGETTTVLRNIPDDSFDVVYIDSSHEYEHTLQELRLCKLKVRRGGVISGHDYECSNHPGVTEAVQEFLEEQGSEMWFRYVDNFSQYLIINCKGTLSDARDNCT